MATPIETPSRNGRPWSSEEHFAVIDLLEANRSYEDIASMVGRTPEAIVWQCRRKIGTTLTKASGFTAMSVAELLGIHKRTVYVWIEKGWLRATRYAVNRTLWRVEEEDLWAFLEDSRYWHVWTPDTIQDQAIKEWCVDLRNDARYLTSAEVCARLGYSLSHLPRLISRGYLKAVRHGYWYRFREEDVANFTPPERRRRTKKLVTVEEKPAKGTKLCTRCRKAKKHSDFYSDRRTSDGLSSHCKLCHRQMLRSGSDARAKKGPKDGVAREHYAQVKAREKAEIVRSEAMKVCAQCSEKKELGEFYKDARTYDGYYSHCKVCHRKKMKRARFDAKV